MFSMLPLQFGHDGVIDLKPLQIGHIPILFNPFCFTDIDSLR
jgi:hypothetical protein